VIEEPRIGGVGPLGLSSHGKKKVACNWRLVLSTDRSACNRVRVKGHEKCILLGP